jgi:hypothetical protein
MMGNLGDAHAADVVCKLGTSDCHDVNAHLPKACGERSCCQLTVGQTRRSAWLCSDGCAHSTIVWNHLHQLWQCGGHQARLLRHVPCQHGTPPADSPALTFILCPACCSQKQLGIVITIIIMIIMMIMIMTMMMIMMMVMIMIMIMIMIMVCQPNSAGMPRDSTLGVQAYQSLPYGPVCCLFMAVNTQGGSGISLAD